MMFKLITHAIAALLGLAIGMLVNYHDETRRRRHAGITSAPRTEPLVMMRLDGKWHDVKRPRIERRRDPDIPHHERKGV